MDGRVELTGSNDITGEGLQGECAAGRLAVFSAVPRLNRTHNGGEEAQPNWEARKGGRRGQRIKARMGRQPVGEKQVRDPQIIECKRLEDIPMDL